MKKYFYFFSLSIICLAAQVGIGQKPDLPPGAVLELGKPAESEIAAKEKRVYQINLTENQFAVVSVEQIGIDVVVRVFNDTDDRPVVQKDLMTKPEGREEVGFLALKTGIYRLEIEAKITSAAGRCRVLLAEIRPPTEKEIRLDEARKLHNDAILLWRKGKYAEAIPFSERSLAIREQQSGAEDLDVAASLANLALITSSAGDYEKAIVLQQRAVQIREKIYGRYHADTARTLHNMAEAYLLIGNYEEAVRTFEKVIEIREKVLGFDNAELATTIGNLGETYRILGDYAKAEELARRSLEIKEKNLAPNSTEIAFGLSSMGSIYADKGDGDKALEYHQRALAIWEKTSGPNHPNTALGLNHLSNVYRGKGDYKTAELYELRALDILQKTLGQTHLRIGNTLGNLAILYNLQGDYAKAESYFQQTVAMFEKTVGKNHRNYSLALYYTAAFYTDTGNYQKAEDFYKEAMAITEKLFGSQHSLTILYLDGLARNYQAKGETAKAVETMTQARKLSEQNTKLILASSAERQKLTHLKALSDETNQYISTHLKFAPDDPKALELALTTILERKGRVSDAMASEFAVLRKRFNAGDQILLDELKETTAKLARQMLNESSKIKPEEYQKQIKQLEEKRENLEVEISRRSSEFRSQIQPVTIAAIRSAIPENAALVEFSVYRPYNPKSAASETAYGEPRYAAYVIHRTGKIEWKDLGAAKTIDDAVELWRQSLRDSKRQDAGSLARAVDEKLMQPIRSLTGSATQILISPDGALNLIPFEALVDEKKSYLVEKYSFTYLTSGRDLLRMQIPRTSKNKLLIVANPSFGEPVGQSDGKSLNGSKSRRSVTAGRDLAETYFAPIGGTTQEANSIKKLFPDAEFLDGTRATETALKQIVAPRILHVATHGFFLQDDKNLNKPAGNRNVNAPAAIENPLLRSGLALTGANRRDGTQDDGILTALEATGLNLWGTKLVVLSACDTGIGEVKNGEGVYGLRRSFVLAGTESLVMSLWSVSDDATRKLMTDYYKNLKQGMGRGAALRQAQLAMLKKDNYQHPFYWAAFIQSGEWANLDGKR